MSRKLVALALVAPFLSTPAAWAYQPYVKAFAKHYRDLRKPIKALDDRCHVCHVGGEDDRHLMNDYGRAIDASGLPSEDDGEQTAAELAKLLPDYLDKVEPMPSRVEGKTFGDLIAAGELPGGTEAVEAAE